MSRIGTEISKLRKAKGLTQKQLGKLVGVAESFIDEVEAGRKVMNDALISRVFKALGQEAGKDELYAPAEKVADKEAVRQPVKTAPKPVLQVWSDALGSVLKTVPVYGYSMDKVVETRQLPIVSNKVEGHPKDKVFYLQIEDIDMAGFRIFKGDLALAYATQEIEKDAIYFVEYNGARAVRQIKRLDADKLLLVSNKGTLVTETAAAKAVKVLGRLIRLEIVL